MGIFAWGLILVLVATSNSLASQRCFSYAQEVRRETLAQQGPEYPYWYNIAQLEAESNCRPDITANDGGQGLSQFMPATEGYVEKLMGEDLDMYNPSHAIRALVFYMDWIVDHEKWGVLWLSYQTYNGGATNLRRELKDAGVKDWELMKLSCLCLGKRAKANCEINYRYSKRIHGLADQYRTDEDFVRYW
jgi:hypothetical protein